MILNDLNVLQILRRISIGRTRHDNCPPVQTVVAKCIDFGARTVPPQHNRQLVIQEHGVAPELVCTGVFT